MVQWGVMAALPPPPLDTTCDATLLAHLHNIAPSSHFNAPCCSVSSSSRWKCLHSESEEEDDEEEV